MAEGKKSFVLYTDLIHVVSKLSDEKAGELFKHILNYVNDNNPETDDILIQIAFEPIKQSLKRDLAKYRDMLERQSVNGSKGGRPKKAKKPTAFSGLNEKPKKADSVNDNDSVNESVIKKEAIPAFNEFKSYAISNKPNIDINALKLKYDSWVVNGWKNGNDKKIKNWKTSLLNTIPYIAEIKQPKVKLNINNNYD